MARHQIVESDARVRIPLCGRLRHQNESRWAKDRLGRLACRNSAACGAGSDPCEQCLVGRGYRFGDSFLQETVPAVSVCGVGQTVVSSKASRCSSILRNGIERTNQERISLIGYFFEIILATEGTEEHGKCFVREFPCNSVAEKIEKSNVKIDLRRGKLPDSRCLHGSIQGDGEWLS